MRGNHVRARCSMSARLSGWFGVESSPIATRCRAAHRNVRLRSQAMNQTSENRIERLMEMEPAAVMDGFRSGRISRRDLSKLFAALGLTTALGPTIGRNPALAQSNELTMIVWEGYTSDSFTVPWEEANDVAVEATFAGTGDEMFAAMQGSGGTTYDMV